MCASIEQVDPVLEIGDYPRLAQGPSYRQPFPIFH